MARNYKPSIALPALCHDDDKQWIESVLMPLSEPHREKARHAYSDIFYKERESEKVEHKKLNKARHEANVRLRVFQSKCLESYVSKTIKERRMQQKESEFNW
ncbi:hypothetical protein [Vibrio phage P23]|nr:hypothetical protein [Vibrio phage P23]